MKRCDWNHLDFVLGFCRAYTLENGIQKPYSKKKTFMRTAFSYCSRLLLLFIKRMTTFFSRFVWRLILCNIECVGLLFSLCLANTVFPVYFLDWCIRFKTIVSSDSLYLFLTVEQKEEYSTFEGSTWRGRWTVQLILKQKNPKLAKTLNVKSFQTVLYVFLIEHLFL